MHKELKDLKKYNTFIYDKFDIEYTSKELKISFYYEISNLEKFIHKLTIPYINKNIDQEFVKKLVFNIGLLELVSYWKATIAPNLIIKCGQITDKQKAFFKKIYYYGLSEFFYRNNINIAEDNFINIVCYGDYYTKDISYKGSGNLIAVGGGKDSCVTLKLLNHEKNNCLIINPKKTMLECAYKAGYEDNAIIKIERIIDKKLLVLNQEGFLNGHTPFSAMVAFVSFLTAYLNNKNKIILSNESSANETNIFGTTINHQYSKTYEFEKDFQDYAKEFLNSNIKYYSFLRPLSEYQISMLFAKKCQEFHHVFKSCNIGSKNTEWLWCCECPKCLFVYSLLAPFLSKEELVAIFGQDLFNNQKLLTTFIELIGQGLHKPFECVGTFEEINYAITKTIKKLNKENLPYLLKYYYEKYYNEDILNKNLEHTFDTNNSLSKREANYLKEVINND